MKHEMTRILAVVDPTRREQWALQKAVLMAKMIRGAEITALLCTYREADCEDPAEFEVVELERNRRWLDDIVAGFAETGVAIDTVVTWRDDWRQAIAEVAAERNAELVLKRASHRPKSLASSDRQLIRSLHCALLLVKSEPVSALRKVLVAVDWNAGDHDHVALNETIIDFGRRLRAAGDELELHAVSAYPDSDRFVHPPDLAKKLGVDRNYAHVRQGKAVDIIPDMASEICADLVVVGSVGRHGISGLTAGNTSEKILEDIHTDVLVIVREEGLARTAA